MKRIILPCLLALILLSACATVQSVIKSSFPYTAVLFIPQSAKPDTENIATSSTSSFDEIFGNKDGNSYVRDVSVALARIDAVDPRSQDLGIFKSVKLYLINARGEQILLASRSDINQFIGSPLTLDVDRSKMVDAYIKGGNLKVRMEYVLRSAPSQDLQVKSTIGFSSLPAAKN